MRRVERFSKGADKEMRSDPAITGTNRAKHRISPGSIRNS